MRRVQVLLLALAAFLATSTARAQFKPEDEKPGGVKFDKEVVQRIRIGMKVKAVGGPCMALYGTVPLPMNWPEQNVAIISEDISPLAKRKPDRTVDGTVKQMIVNIPTLKSGEEAKALLVLEMRRRAIIAPDDTTVFSLPEKDKLDTALKAYLAPSPKIESNNSQIVQVAKKVLEEHKDATAWEQVEAIYDWVRDNVKYENGPLKGALRAMKDKTGDCEEMTSLFIALCRAGNIPARTVWVPGHCYPEFYLVDRQGAGHWFPCQAAGSRAFGGIPETRPILQKGDSFKDVDRPREKMRYLSEFLTGKNVKGGGKPQVSFLREDVATDRPLDDPATDISPIKPVDGEDKPTAEAQPMPDAGQAPNAQEKPLGAPADGDGGNNGSGKDKNKKPRILPKDVGPKLPAGVPTRPARGKPIRPTSAPR